MAVYWHPLLVQFLRHDYGDRLIIEDEVSLGDMPLRADLVLIRRDPHLALPFPFGYLGQRTLVEYKGPDDTAGQPDLLQLEIYGLLYQQKEKLFLRRDLTLWLLASSFADDVSLPGGAHLADDEEVGQGVRRGTLDGFPAFLIDLSRLPVEETTLPLLMVSKGQREQELVEYLVEHHERCADYLAHVLEMHWKTFSEVLAMKNLTLEQIGFDLDEFVEYVGTENIVKLFGKKNVIRLLGEENVVRLLGEENVVRLLGEENVVRLLGEGNVIKLLGEDEIFRYIGKDRIRKWLEEHADETDDNTES